MLELDHRIGQVLAALERSGLARDTLVVVSSDNGAETHYRNRIVQYAHYSNGELKGGKRDIYEGGHRVPFIARWPAVITAGRRTAEVVSQIDLFATLADIAGAKIPPNAAEDSFSLLPVFKGEDYARPLRAPVIHLSGNGFFSIRDGRWKLNLFRGSGGSLAPTFLVPKANEPPFELYDMTEDWRETRNVHDQHPEVVARLEARATEFVRNGRSTPGARQKNEGPELWPELTWISGAPPLPAVPAGKKARASQRE